MQAVYAFFSYAVPRDTAEDLTSTTFERVIRAWDRYDPDRASERTWILAIARNALMDHHRRQRLRKTTSLDEHPAIADRFAADDAALARTLSMRAFVDRLRALPERDRQVLALRYGADLSARDVAKALGLSEDNVHQIASRALRKLRDDAAVSGNAPPRA